MSKVKAERLLKMFSFVQSDVNIRAWMMLNVIGTRFYCSSARLTTQFIQLVEPATAGIIILNRPNEVNAITQEMSEYVENLILDFGADKKCVYVLGKYFTRLKNSRRQRHMLSSRELVDVLFALAVT